MKLKVQLQEAVENTMQHILNNDYTAIMISGRSSFVSKSLLESISKKQNIKLPKIYDLGVPFNDGVHFAYYNDDLTGPLSILKDYFPELLQVKGKKLYLDDYCDRGHKMRFLQDFFPRLGISPTEFATLVASPEYIGTHVFAGISNDQLRNNFHKTSMALKAGKIPDFSITRKVSPLILLQYLHQKSKGMIPKRF